MKLLNKTGGVFSIMDDNELKNILESENTSGLYEFIIKNKHKIPNKKSLISKKEKTKTIQTIDAIDSSQLYIADSSIHGFGVFAKSDILKDSIIETCYTIELEFRERYHKDKTILNYSYSLHDGSDQERLTHGSKLVFLTGNGMLYNHSDDHSSEWRWVSDKKYVDLISVKEIKKGSEITINYGSGYWQRLNNAKA